MHRRHHGRAPGGHGATLRDETSPRRDVATTMLALQRSAGNRAVGALLARAPAGAPEKSEQPERSATVTLAGIGAVQAESVQFPARRGGGWPGPGGRGRERPPGGDLIVASRVGPHSTALGRASVDGKGMDGRVDFPGREIRVEFRNAIVASYQVSPANGGATESWTLDVESIEFVTRQPDGHGT